MKLALPVLALSANAATLLAPLYEAVAKQLVKQTTNLLTSISQVEPIASAPGAVSAITTFNDALDNMDSSALVSIIENLDISTLVDANGAFNADALVTVFNSLPADDVQALQTEFIAAMDPSTMDKLNSSMDSLLDMSSVFRDIMNNEIEWSNFVAIFNDFTTAVIDLDSAFGNQLLGSSMNAFYTYSGYVTQIAEKALVIYESYDDIYTSYRNAGVLVEFGFQDRLKELGWTEGDAKMCSLAENGIIDSAKEMVDFIPDVVSANYVGPLTDTLKLYNDFVHALPYLGDYKVDPDLIQTCFDTVDDYADAVSGTLVEVSVLIGPFTGYLDTAMVNAVC